MYIPRLAERYPMKKQWYLITVHGNNLKTQNAQKLKFWCVFEHHGFLFSSKASLLNAILEDFFMLIRSSTS